MLFFSKISHKSTLRIKLSKNGDSKINKIKKLAKFEMEIKSPPGIVMIPKRKLSRAQEDCVFDEDVIRKCGKCKDKSRYSERMTYRVVTSFGDKHGYS